MSLQVELNLQQLATTAVAIRAWEHPNVQERLRDFFAVSSDVFNSSPTSSLYNIMDFNKISELAIKETVNCAKANLPKEVITDLEGTISVIGRKLFYWSQFVICDLGLDNKQIENVCWTSKGTIEEVKTFKKFWLTDENFNLNRSGSSLFGIASLFVQKKFISVNFDEMVEEIKIFCIEKCKQIEFQVSNDLKKLKFPEKFHQTVELFFLCLHCGLDKAVKHFAETLDKAIEPFLKKAVLICFQESKNMMKNDYMREKYVEIFLFLLTKMSKESKFQLFKSEIHNILSLMLNVWPYEQLCLPILTFTLKYSDAKFCNRFLKDFVHRHLILKPTLNRINLNKKQIYYKIFRMLMKTTPRGTKIALFLKKSVMEEIFKSLNFLILKLIISDSDLKDYRDDMIHLLNELLKETVKNENFDVFENFIKHVLRFHDEKKILMFEFNFLNELLTTGLFDAAQKYLIWLDISDERKLKIQIRIDLMNVCSGLILNKSDPELISRLYCFGSEVGEEKKKGLIDFYNVMFNGFCKIWCTKFRRDEELARTISDEFLKSFLKPKKIQFFKKEKFVQNEHFVQLFCSHLVNAKDFEIIDDLFEFCGVGLEKIKDIKLKIVENIGRWIDFYSVKRDDFLIIHAIINWVFEDNVTKREAIQHYVNSEEGVSLCFKLIKENEYKIRDSDTFIFLNEWIRPCKNLDILMVKIGEMKRVGKIVKDYVLCMIKSVYDQGYIKDEYIVENIERDFVENMVEDIDQYAAGPSKVESVAGPSFDEPVAGPSNIEAFTRPSSVKNFNEESNDDIVMVEDNVGVETVSRPNNVDFPEVIDIDDPDLEMDFEMQSQILNDIKQAKVDHEQQILAEINYYNDVDEFDDFSNLS